MNRTLELTVPMPSAAATDRAVRALAAVGTVKHRSPQFIEGTVTHGLQQVRVHVSWAADTGGIRLILQGTSDDVWGAGAKSALERLEATIRNLDVPGYQVDRRGMNPAALVGLLVGFVLLLLVLIPLVTQSLGLGR